MVGQIWNSLNVLASEIGIRFITWKRRNSHVQEGIKTEMVFWILTMNEQENKGSGLCKQTPGPRNLFCPQFLAWIAEPNLAQSSSIINKQL